MGARVRDEGDVEVMSFWQIVIVIVRVVVVVVVLGERDVFRWVPRDRHVSVFALDLDSDLVLVLGMDLALVVLSPWRY